METEYMIQLVASTEPPNQLVRSNAMRPSEEPTKVDIEDVRPKLLVEELVRDGQINPHIGIHSHQIIAKEQVETITMEETQVAIQTFGATQLTVELDGKMLFLYLLELQFKENPPNAMLL
jgi:hypothetical protein